MSPAATGPLAGRRILVTRRPEQAASLIDGLRQLGAEVVAAPLLAVAPPLDPGPLDRALRELPSYHWLVFTSANAVEAVHDRLAGLGASPRLPPTVRLAVVGPSTAAALVEHFPGAAPPLQPASEFRAEGLLSVLAATDVAGRRVLLPVSDRARDTLAAGLRALAAEVDAPVAYRTLSPESARAALQDALARGVDLVTLASPSAVEALVAAADEAGRRLPVAVIGPVTEKAARDAGLTVRAVASPATVPGLVAAIEACWPGRP